MQDSVRKRKSGINGRHRVNNMLHSLKLFIHPGTAACPLEHDSVEISSIVEGDGDQLVLFAVIQYLIDLYERVTEIVWIGRGDGGFDDLVFCISINASNKHARCLTVWVIPC